MILHRPHSQPSWAAGWAPRPSPQHSAREVPWVQELQAVVMRHAPGPGVRQSTKAQRSRGFCSGSLGSWESGLRWTDSWVPHYAVAHWVSDNVKDDLSYVFANYYVPSFSCSFTSINPLTLHSNLRKWTLTLTPFHRWQERRIMRAVYGQAYAATKGQSWELDQAVYPQSPHIPQSQDI